MLSEKLCNLKVETLVTSLCLDNIDEKINYLNELTNVKEIWIECIFSAEDEGTVDNLTSLKLLERIQSASVLYELYKKEEEETDEERELLQRLLARGFKIEVTNNNEDPLEDEEG